MDEVKKKIGQFSRINQKVKGFVFSEPVSFSNKKRVNFRGLAWLGGVGVAVACIAIVLMPTPEPQRKTFNEHGSVSAEAAQNTSSPRNDTGAGYTVPTVRSGGGSGGSAAASNRNTSMIIARDNDASTTLPAGTKIQVKLLQAVTVTGQAIPVIVQVTQTVTSDTSVAIPQDAKLFGDATLDIDSERAHIALRSVMLPDGESRDLLAVALGNDNQLGVDGDFHSDALKNTAGIMISKFVGGFAEGAMNRGAFGANQGGVENGLLDGASATAQDRAAAWSESLKKPKAWLCLAAGTQFAVILSQPFKFRDPGAIN